jgi:hypothetical protein
MVEHGEMAGINGGLRAGANVLEGPWPILRPAQKDERQMAKRNQLLRAWKFTPVSIVRLCMFCKLRTGGLLPSLLRKSWTTGQQKQSLAQAARCGCTVMHHSTNERCVEFC